MLAEPKTKENKRCTIPGLRLTSLLILLKRVVRDYIEVSLVYSTWTVTRASSFANQDPGAGNLSPHHHNRGQQDDARKNQV